MNKRILIAVLAAVLAGLGIVSLVVWANGARDRAFSGTETVTVYQVVKDVPAGTDADALRGSVEQVKLPRASVPGTAVTSLSTLQGKVTTASLVPGEVLVAGRFGSTKNAADLPVPKGLQEVTVELASARVLGGVLKRGDRVGVIASYVQQNPQDSLTNFAANRALVLSVVAVGGVGQQPADNNNDQTPVGGNLQVRLALPSLSVEKVVNAQEFGKVWLSRQNKDADINRQLVKIETVLK